MEVHPKMKLWAAWNLDIEEVGFPDRITRSRAYSAQGAVPVRVKISHSVFRQGERVESWLTFAKCGHTVCSNFGSNHVSY